MLVVEIQKALFVDNLREQCKCMGEVGSVLRGLLYSVWYDTMPL